MNTSTRYVKTRVGEGWGRGEREGARGEKEREINISRVARDEDREELQPATRREEQLQDRQAAQERSNYRIDKLLKRGAATG